MAGTVTLSRGGVVLASGPESEVLVYTAAHRSGQRAGADVDRRPEIAAS